jgi:hypothetical protein
MLSEAFRLHWQCLLLLFWAAACFFWARGLVTGRGLWPAFILTLLTLLTATTLEVLEWQAAHEKSYPRVVITMDGTALRRGNGESYPCHPTIPTMYEGMEGRRLAQRGDWLQIELPRGQVGWVPRNSVVAVGQWDSPSD